MTTTSDHFLRGLAAIHGVQRESVVIVDRGWFQWLQSQMRTLVDTTDPVWDGPPVNLVVDPEPE